MRTKPMLGRGGRRSAFSLTEMVVSMVVTTLVTGGLVSAMVIASKGMNAEDSALSRVSNTARVVDEMAAELFSAQTVTERTAGAITFTVADRDGDLNPETIRYAWSGTAGAPLTRAYNGQPAVNVVDGIAAFELAYRYKSVTVEGAPSTNESGEMLLISHEPSVNLLGLDIGPGSWGGEYFQPALPPEAVSWRVTRLAFRAKKLLSLGGAIRVQLRRPASGTEPSTTVVAEDTVPEKLLGLLFNWYEVAYSGAGGLSPDEGLCVVLMPDVDSGGGSATLEIQSSGASVPGGSFLASTDGGSSWSVSDAKALAFRVYGTVTTLGDPPIVNRTFLTAVDIRVAAGPDAGRYSRTSAVVLNAPEVGGL